MKKQKKQHRFVHAYWALLTLTHVFHEINCMFNLEAIIVWNRGKEKPQSLRPVTFF